MINIKEIDQALGKCVRLYRTMSGMTQTELGDKIGVSFQQIQKYENGSTRISAAQLLNLSLALDVSVVEFYDRLAELSEAREVKSHPRNVEMLMYFQKLPQSVQKSLIEVARTVVGEVKS